MIKCWSYILTGVLLLSSALAAFAEPIPDNAVFSMHECIERGLKLNPKIAAEFGSIFPLGRARCLARIIFRSKSLS